MSLVLLAISLSIALGVLAFRFAVFALPVMAGIATFLQVHEGGSGFGLSVLVGLAGAAASVVLVIAILGFARNPFLRLTIRPGFPVRVIVTRDLVFGPSGG